VADTFQAAPNDLELARAAAVGDRSAFETLYQRHYRRVYSLCLRMTGSPEEAEDLTQDVFIQLYRRIGSYRGEALFTTWLHRLTVNQVLMRFRKRAVKFESITVDGELPLPAEPEGSPRTLPIIDAIALDRAIAKLPPGYRTVFVLHDIEGYEHEEIAHTLGVTIGTSKSQLHKARLKLRELLLKKV
jgi:RNA polymerase sigma-70 factor, ECF subfamily